MWNFIKKIRRIYRISLVKTIFFNFYMLPFSKAIKCPVLISRNTYFYSLSGKMNIEGNVKFGMIKFGLIGEDLLVWKEGKILLRIDGELIFRGTCGIGNGCVISVSKGCTLDLGDQLSINIRTKIVCRDYIKIGDCNLIAFEVQIFDTDFHYIEDVISKEIKPKTSPVIIGSNNWIGNRVSILKGTRILNNCIIASNSLCNKEYPDSYSIFAGIPAKRVREGVSLSFEDDIVIDKFFQNDKSRSFSVHQ